MKCCASERIKLILEQSSGSVESTDYYGCFGTDSVHGTNFGDTTKTYFECRMSKRRKSHKTGENNAA